MTLTEIIAGYEAAKATRGIVKSTWDLFRHDTKDRVGSVRMTDAAGRRWKVRVRHTGKRGSYLKLTTVTGPEREIRASAEGYKPGLYAPVTREEWVAFALFAEGDDNWGGRSGDPALLAAVTTVFERLVASP